ncbi:UDP-N-acetylmuramoyl-tripeptide--D-alanyl-D-alanine ligase [Desulfovibrio porci]|uniref:UDP-N-acetylmuramoyl-tripeptide--D-alanyl-D- alanine ligase n=1 Tax=Desulfovibrio porci TaxID=2605782 RepID=UPI001E3BE22F|nr:UDP-N-acetylmuramoyl-tripeptide--D-alanyl-D-alanine ligase [Desulfovibrio porci]
MRLSTTEMAAHLGLTGAAAPAGEALASRVVTDSREARPGALFVCVPGERVDGHDFAARAVEQGATAVLASRPLPDPGVPVLLVEDTVRALGQLAALWRGKTRAKVVCVTGTAGKTTLKEALAQVLALRGKTARTAMNHNNQIGMPCAVLNTDGDEDFWVMEAGISHAGDMDELAPVLRPDLGLILNVGPGHTEGLGDRGVPWHKARLLAYLAEGGRGLVSADYPELVREAMASGAKLHFFSAADQRTAYRAAWLGSAPADGNAADGAPERGLYRLWLDGETCDVITPFQGAYGAENSIATAAAAHLLGLSAAEIAEGLARTRLPVQRFNRSRLGAWELIDDTYNANPLSMRRMLDAAAGQARGRTFVPVLGEMGELGAVAEAMHEELGRHLADLKPTAVFWKGGHADEVRAGLAHGGYGGPWLIVDGPESFMAAWKEFARHGGLEEKRGGLLLFKGSRFNRLETLLTAFREGNADMTETETRECGEGESGHVL